MILNISKEADKDPLAQSDPETTSDHLVGGQFVSIPAVVRPEPSLRD